MAKEKPQKNEIKVTDKRIFTAEGEIREEFREEIKPSDPVVAATAPPAPEQPQKKAETPPPKADDAHDRRRTVGEQGANPGTPYCNFIESLVIQAYMSLGMLRSPHQPPGRPDVAGARQIIDIISLLQEKTRGNLTDEESEFVEALLGELKLAYVQLTKSLG